MIPKKQWEKLLVSFLDTGCWEIDRFNSKEITLRPTKLPYRNE